MIFEGVTLPFDYISFKYSYIVAVSLLVEETGVSGENHQPVASH
jgi:hypothetical protein